MGDEITVEISHKNSDGASITRNDGSMIKVEGALKENLHVHEDAHEREQNQVPNLQSTVISLQKDNMSHVLNNHLKSDCTTKTHGNLTKSATFPSSEKTLPSSALDGGGGASDTALHGQNSLKCENPCYNRSMSMPTPLKLVSAMKGSREQQGTPRLVKLNVKWAPDVYEPPATSMSHTVKSNHHQRPKGNRRKDQKTKRKSKSARGSSNDKKHQGNRRSAGSSDHMQLRSEASNRSQPVDGFDQPKEEVASSSASSDNLVLLHGFDQKSEVDMSSINVVELSVGRKDSKCGRSFRASPAKVHLPIAEAT